MIHKYRAARERHWEWCEWSENTNPAPSNIFSNKITPTTPSQIVPPSGTNIRIYEPMYFGVQGLGLGTLARNSEGMKKRQTNVVKLGS